MDFDNLMAVGSMSGSGGVIVMDDTTDMVEALANINYFYAHESWSCILARRCSLDAQVTQRMVDVNRKEMRIY